MKQDYWKCVSDSGITIFCKNRVDALENAEREREGGSKAYVRKVRIEQILT